MVKGKISLFGQETLVYDYDENISQPISVDLRYLPVFTGEAAEQIFVYRKRRKE